jgi:signal transduction histidine kinase
MSIRARVLLVVVAGAILPLAIVGAWLTRSGMHAGEALLRSQLDSSLANIAAAVERRWELRRGDLLFLADNDVARRLLSSPAIADADARYLSDLPARIDRTIIRFAYVDSAGTTRWASDSVGGGRADAVAGNPAVTAQTFEARIPITDSTGAALGTLTARLLIRGVLPLDSARLLVPGAALVVREVGSGALRIGLPGGGGGFPESERTTIDGADWLASSRRLDPPGFDVAVAAPSVPYVAPFARAWRTGLAALLVVTLMALMLTTWVVSRLADSMRELVGAADAVAHGDVARRVPEHGPTEVRRVATAFNIMTDSVRRMLAELSQRRALAAVGEFAASLSHEVRNALTSVQVDLQLADERMEDDARTRALVARAQSQLRRLDSAVSGALSVARGGRVEPRVFDLRDAITAAAQAAAPSFAAAGGVVDVAVDGEVVVRGDPDALRQLFLNLLLKTAQALDTPGGRASVRVGVEDGYAMVTVEDSGRGIPPEDLERVLQPFVTTRVHGTGLGLPIARQIAIAHNGELTIRSTRGEGSAVVVRIPCLGQRDRYQVVAPVAW